MLTELIDEAAQALGEKTVINLTKLVNKYSKL